jgi:hypothetical protein
MLLPFVSAFSARVGVRPLGLALFCLLAVGGLGFAGCQTMRKDRDYDPVVARFFVEGHPREATIAVATLPRSGLRVPINPKPVFVETDIVAVELVRVDLGLCLYFQFTPDASRDLYRLSTNNLGRRLVLSLNGTALGVRSIESAFNTGDFLIFVEIADHELEEVALNLQRTTRDIQQALAKGRRK